MPENTFRTECPYCSTMGAFELKAQFRGTDGWHLIYVCPNPGCRKTLYLQFAENARYEVNYDDQISRHPIAVSNLHVSVPREVADDYTEAMKCLRGGSAKGALTMFRRCIQTASRNMGAKPGDLLDEIDELAGSGRITTDLKDLAHQIRLLGNEGAHPNRPNVSPGEASEIKDFADNFLNYIYILPHQVKEMKARNAAAKSAKK